MALSKNKKPYIFTYQTKCLVNGKTYIGYHSTYNLNDGYIGCGVRSQAYALASKKHGIKSAFIDAVIKYGYDNFSIEYLCFFDTVEEAKAEEEFLVNEEYVRRSDNYNITLGGRGGFPLRTTKEKRDEIISDFMSGMKKSDVIAKHSITSTIMYRITKMYDLSSRSNADSEKTIFIKDWISKNSEEYIRRYVNREITKNQINLEIPFDLYRNDFLKGIKQKPYLYLYIEGCKIPIYGSMDIVRHTGVQDARVSLAVKFTRSGKKYRGFTFSEY